jgi:hypothetical protein
MEVISSARTARLASKVRPAKRAHDTGSIASNIFARHATTRYQRLGCSSRAGEDDGRVTGTSASFLLGFKLAACAFQWRRFAALFATPSSGVHDFCKRQRPPQSHNPKCERHHHPNQKNEDPFHASLLMRDNRREATLARGA